MVDKLRGKCPNLIIEWWIGIEEYVKVDVAKEHGKVAKWHALDIERSVKKAKSVLAQKMFKRMQTTGSMSKKSFLSKSSNISAELDKVVGVCLAIFN